MNAKNLRIWFIKTVDVNVRSKGTTEDVMRTHTKVYIMLVIGYSEIQLLSRNVVVMNIYFGFFSTCVFDNGRIPLYCQ